MDIVVYSDGATMFRDEELRDISEVEKGLNFIEVKCLLKSKDHGEQVGKLKISADGKLEINCDCVPDCQQGKHNHGEVERFLRPRQAVHRNEFVRCCKCGKERRFYLRTMEECRTYHEAVASGSWTCDQNLYRAKARWGCLTSPKCEGCMACVCMGSGMCRFEDCNCQTCIDFIQNLGQ
ncbi:protein ULTRAPETALA 2-like [Camellia sinensis]|uniref:protein ULTRAPETALA 2-like n=1 Tax=Camellia sinensis TaxID=4442 RepID=UPI001036B99C|nr:protein ULTRAPETALA 2-like [Camellia sinensis]